MLLLLAKTLQRYNKYLEYAKYLHKKAHFFAHVKKNNYLCRRK